MKFMIIERLLANSGPVVSLILACLAQPMFGYEAQSQSRAEQQLQKEVDKLTARVTNLEAVQRSIGNIVCGRMQSEWLKNNRTIIYPFVCQLDRPPSQINRPRLKAALIRPGIFRFEFDPPRHQQPVVLSTALERWGNVPAQISNLRVADVSENGFTIETFEAAELPNPSNVGFFFFVLARNP